MWPDACTSLSNQQQVLRIGGLLVCYKTLAARPAATARTTAADRFPQRCRPHRIAATRR